MSRRTDIVGIKDTRKLLISYDLFEALCRVKRKLENPATNVFEYKGTNEYYRDVTTIQACCKLLGISHPMIPEDTLDTMINKLLGGHASNMIPNREVILTGSIPPTDG